MKIGLSKRLAILALVVIPLALTGCTSGGGSTKADNSATPSTLQQVIKRGTLRVAVLPDFPPSSVKQATGKIVGYEPDIAELLAKSLGVKLELVPVDGTARLSVMQSGRADVNISSYTATNERAQKTAFTIPYKAQGAGVLFRKSNPIKSLKDLDGKTVAVARGSTNDTIITENFPQAKPVRFDNIADALQALKSGKTDAVMEESTSLQTDAKGSADLEVLNVPPIDPDLISMGVLPDQQVWLNYLNNFIRNLISSGQDNTLYHKWFHTDLPSIITNQP
jgi:polar amino acid transport system substrate-binding protein